MIFPGRYSAELDGEFVVFMIGARINKPWKVRQWGPVGKAMSTMQRELAENPDIGCLHVQNFGAVNGISVQYWRSFEHLERFARSDEWSHLAAWRSFNKLIRDSGDLGIWHETYRVADGAYEAVYGNMPVMGLASAGSHVELGRGSTAASRANVRDDDVAPVEDY